MQLTSERGKETITYHNRFSFSLKCEITSSNGDTRTDTHSVSVGKKADNYIENSSGNLLPEKFALTNYPNPFNSETAIKLALPNEDYVSISVYNSIGQEIKSIISRNLDPGFYNFKWNGIDNAGNSSGTGLYIIVVQTENKVFSLKTLLDK